MRSQALGLRAIATRLLRGLGWRWDTTENRGIPIGDAAWRRIDRTYSKRQAEPTRVVQPRRFNSVTARIAGPHETTNDLRAEIINARVYGGMHFRNSVEVGATLGEHVADWVAYVFRPRSGESDVKDRDDGSGRR